MHILALEPYFGGSHKSFLEGLIENSEHKWTVLTLPPFKWKWRMRHSAFTFSSMLKKEYSDMNFDAVFCSDMVNFAEFKGMAPGQIRKLPSVVYFHENQLTYPVRFEDERDYQYVLTNMTTALAADAVWFNSDFHRNEFLDELAKFLVRMPDYQPIEAVDEIKKKSSVKFPGINYKQANIENNSDIRTILWAARWEHDKNPEDFFKALRIVKKSGLKFKLNVIGESFREIPEVFEAAKYEFEDEIDRWGYQKSREDFERALKESDFIVSTANHEFFGIAILEAMAKGCCPVLPRRLAYPEIADIKQNRPFFYDGSAEGLARKLQKLLSMNKRELAINKQKALARAEYFCWKNQAAKIDQSLSELVKGF